MVAVEEIVFRRVRTWLLNKTLGRYMSEWSVEGVGYPVVVGGAAVTRCMSRSPTTRALIDHSFASDIDLPFVCVTTRNQLSTVLKARAGFLSAVINDQELQAYLQSLKQKYNLTEAPRLVLNDLGMRIKRLRVYKLLLISIDLVMLQGTKGKLLIDCPIYARWNVEDFGVYETVRQKTSSTTIMPIPVYTHRRTKTRYATCSFVYYDTVRMMVWYAQSHVSSKTQRQQEFAAVKLRKYVAKFAALYVMQKDLMGNASNQRYPTTHLRSVLELYAKVQAVLKLPPTSDIQDINEMIKRLRKMTNLVTLEAAIAKAHVSAGQSFD